MQDSISNTEQLTADEITLGLTATFNGVKAGIKNIIHTVAHPIDTIIYPVSKLVYDATIIAAAQCPTSSADYLIIKQLINKNPQLYIDATNSMKNRINNIKQMGLDINQAPFDKKIEILMSTMTTVWVPGQVLRGIKVISNLNTFGIANPPKFHNQIWDDIPSTKADIKYYSLDDIKNIKGYKALMFAFTADRELLISDIYAAKPVIRPARSYNGGEPLIDIHILHHDLAQLKPVYAVGDILAKDGKIVEISNSSGHYLPQGEHLAQTIENAFIKNGFKEAKGKFRDMAEELGWDTKPTTSKDKIKGSLKPGVVLVTGKNESKDKDRVTNLKENEDGIPTKILDEDILDSNNIPYDHIPCSANFNLEGVPEFTNKANNAKVSQSRIVELLQEESFDNISPQARVNLINLSRPIQEFGMLGLKVSQLALMTGGHARTWRGVNNACQGALELGFGLSAIASSSSYLSLAACTGYVGVAIGAMGFAMSIFGDDDSQDDAMQAIMAGINQINQGINTIINILQDIHKTLVEGFQRLEEILICGVLTKLNQINSKLDRLERITTFSFKELHTKELVDIIDIIKKEICGEYTLSDSKKSKYLLKLSTWLDCHSRAQIQTFSLRGSNNGDLAKIVEILSDPEITVNTMLPLFLTELISLVPDLNSVIGKDLVNLPNLDVFLAVCDTYLLVSNRPGYSGNLINNNILVRSKDIISKIIDIINKLHNYKYKNVVRLPDILFRQYDYYRLQVGFAIVKCRGEYSKLNPPPNTSLKSCLKSGNNSENLLNLLDEMELRRVILIKLDQFITFTQGSIDKDKLNKLESKTEILNNPISDFGCVDGPWSTYAQEGKLFEFKRGLEMGTDPNMENIWGAAIHQITKYAKRTSGLSIFKYHENTMLHLLFKYPDLRMHTPTKYDLNDTWGASSTPILHALNQAQFGMGVLFCANGFDISGRAGNGENGWGNFHGSHLGNCVKWANQGDTNCVITVRFVAAMNNEKHVFNKKDLREAYKYYKLVESGFFDIDYNNISLECVLLLCCILGDLLPFQLLQSPKTIEKLQLNALIPDIGLTYLMLACIFNQQTVATYLEKSGAGKHITSDLKLKSKNITCFDLAFMNGSWLTAHMRGGINTSLEDKNKVQEMINKHFLGVWTSEYCQAPLWQIKSDSKPKGLISSSIKNYVTKDNLIDVVSRIDKCLEKKIELKNTNSDYVKILGNCKLFAKLLLEFSSKSSVNPELVNSAYEELSKLLKLQSPKLFELANAFNILDAILKLDPNYRLGPNVEKLIKEIDIVLN